MVQNIWVMVIRTVGPMMIMLLLWGCTAVKPAPNKLEWHTPPDRWQEPRIYQTSMDDDSSFRITLDHQKRTESTFTIKVFSPNKVYWFAVNADWPDPPVEECNGTEFLMTESEAEIFVFTERDYLLRINMPEHYRNFAIRTGWVNERLLYVRVWWGRIRASDIIIDVENERMVYSETTYSGLPAFQQWNPETE